MEKAERLKVPPILGIILAYVMKYLANGLLAFTILSTFGALMIGYISIIGEDMPFLRYIDFLLPLDDTGSGTLHGGDILRVFSYLATITFGLSEAFRAIKRLLFPNARTTGDVTFTMALKRSVLISLLIITIIFALAAIAMPFAPLSENTTPLEMYIVLGAFYATAIFFYGLFKTIDTIADIVIMALRSRSMATPA